MRALRAVVLAGIASLALLGGIASTAFADDGSDAIPAATDPGDPGLPPDVATLADPVASPAATDPGDPGLPPD